MTTIAQTDCCTLLGIDPKTLRHWLRQAKMPFTPHPTDARFKCLTQAQVQQLAALRLVCGAETHLLHQLVGLVTNFGH